MIFGIVLIIVSSITYELGYIVGKKLGNVYGTFTYDPESGKIEIKLEDIPSKERDYIVLRYHIKEDKEDE